MNRIQVSTTINGDAVEFLCEPQETLLDVLRDELGMTGSKEGCACLMLGAEAEGRDIGTIEGVSDGERLHVLQSKFLEHAALQCGICTPGIIVAAKSLLERNPDPDEEEVRYWLAGNLCRCTGYDKIIRAVMDAAQEMRKG